MLSVSLCGQVEVGDKPQILVLANTATLRSILSTGSGVPDVDLERVVVSTVMLEEYSNTSPNPQILRLTGHLGDVANDVHVAQDPAQAMSILMPFASGPGRYYMASGNHIHYPRDLRNVGRIVASPGLTRTGEDQPHTLTVKNYHECYPMARIEAGDTLVAPTECTIVDNAAGEGGDMTVPDLVLRHMKQEVVVDISGGISVSITPLVTTGKADKGGAGGDANATTVVPASKSTVTLVLSLSLGAVAVQPDRDSADGSAAAAASVDPETGITGGPLEATPEAAHAP